MTLKIIYDRLYTFTPTHAIHYQSLTLNTNKFVSYSSLTHAQCSHNYVIAKMNHLHKCSLVGKRTMVLVNQLVGSTINVDIRKMVDRPNLRENISILPTPIVPVSAEGDNELLMHALKKYIQLR